MVIFAVPRERGRAYRPSWAARSVREAARAVRLFGTELLTVRIDLDSWQSSGLADAGSMASDSATVETSEFLGSCDERGTLMLEATAQGPR